MKTTPTSTTMNAGLSYTTTLSTLLTTRTTVINYGKRAERI